jgi:TonB family protein
VRRALLGSLIFHVALTVVIFALVAFKQVNYVKRDVYEVKLVGAVQTASVSSAPKVQAAPPPQPKPAPVEEKKVEEKPDQMPAPPTKPTRPKPVEKKQQSVPTTDITKTDARPDSDKTGAAGQEAAPGPPGDTPTMGSVQIDGGNFPFASYISRMRQKIATTWEVPAGTEGLERSAVVYFRVHRDGSVTNVEVEKSSALQLFDRSCQRAVMEAAPLPPLPREYNDEFVAIHFSFVYQPTQ